MFTIQGDEQHRAELVKMTVKTDSKAVHADKGGSSKSIGNLVGLVCVFIAEGLCCYLPQRARLSGIPPCDNCVISFGLREQRVKATERHGI